MAKFRFFVSTKYVGSAREEIVEVPDEELEGMSEYEQNDYVHETYYRDWLDNNCSMDFYKLEEDE